MSILFGTKKNTLILYFHVDPKVAFERIQKREAEEGVEADPHENREDLRKPKAEFDIVLEIAFASGYKIFEIDTNEKSPEDVATEAELALRQALDPTPATGPLG